MKPERPDIEAIKKKLELVEDRQLLDHQPCEELRKCLPYIEYLEAREKELMSVIMDEYFRLSQEIGGYELLD